MCLRNKTVTNDIDYCIFFPQLSSKFAEKILQVWLILLCSRQANLFLGWTPLQLRVFGFQKTKFSSLPQADTLVSGLTHTEILCGLNSGYPSVKKAALELCMLFFIFTEETVLAQLCSHCKCCCCNILTINAAKFSLWSTTFFFVDSLHDGCCILQKFMFFIWKRSKGRNS